jgi:hypothetical protein
MGLSENKVRNPMDDNHFPYSSGPRSGFSMVFPIFRHIHMLGSQFWRQHLGRMVPSISKSSVLWSTLRLSPATPKALGEGGWKKTDLARDLFSVNVRARVQDCGVGYGEISVGGWRNIVSLIFLVLLICFSGSVMILKALTGWFR